MLTRFFWCTMLMVMAALGICACREKEAPAPKLKKQEIRAREVRERGAINEFAKSLQEILEWRQTLSFPMNEAEHTAMMNKLQQVPVSKDLPDSLAKVWQDLVEISLKMKDPAQKEKWRAMGADAAAEVNRQLAAFGYPELRF